MEASSEEEELPMAVAIDSGAEALDLYQGGAIAEQQAHVPVTLITGYLGAGKTTLVRYILNERHGYRIAVILNEYGGETGLESAFVQDEQGDRANVPQWVELANGCLCCSVKAEFVQALEGLLASGSRHAGKFDYVLVETTGLANPGPIMSELWTDEELEAAVVLDGVVAVVDGRNVGRQLGESRPGGAANEAQLQVALADVILLNKMDLLNESQAAAVQVQLRSINSAAAIIPTTHSKVDLGQLLNRGAYRLRLLEQLQPDPGSSSIAPEAAAGAAAVQRPLQWLGEVSAVAVAAAASTHDHHHGGSCSTPGCSNPEHSHAHQAGRTLSGPCQAHDAAVRTISLRVARPVLLERFRSWVETLIWEHPAAAQQHAKAAAAAPEAEAVAAAAVSVVGQQPELLRMKGLLHVAGSDRAHMFQAVYDLYDIVPGTTWDQLQQHLGDGGTGNGASSGGAAGGAAGSAAGGGSGSEAFARLTRLVLIGRYLDQQQLQQQLEQCCVDEGQ